MAIRPKKIEPHEIDRIILLVSPSELDDPSQKAIDSTITYKTLSAVAKQDNPRKSQCWLIYTSQSKKTARYLRTEFSSPFHFGNVPQINDVYDALNIYELILQVACDPINAGHVVYCDCTGGTKTMSIAVALACTHFNLISESNTKLILTHIPPKTDVENFLFHEYDISHVVAEEQRRYVDQQAQIGRLHYLSRISSFLAHEIKNSLSTINTATHLIQKQPQSNKNEGRFNKIKAKIIEIENIIENVQQTVREEAKTSIIPKLRLIEVIRKIKGRTARRFPELTLEVNEDQSRDITLRIIEEKLYSILANLIDNAAEATHGKGKISIDVEHKNNMLHICVQDNGPGIPMEMRANVFKPMHRSTSQAGTGMGLSIVKTFVIEEGGSITLDVNYKKGARFLIELPLEQNREAQNDTHTSS